MCLITRLPAIEIKHTIAACCGPNGITYFGGDTCFEPSSAKKRRRGGKKHRNRKVVAKTATATKKVPTRTFFFEANMSLPASQMHAQIVPIRIPSDADRYYFNYTHHQKRTLPKHRRQSIRMLALQFLQ